MRIEDEKSGNREVEKMGIFELSPLIKEKDRRNPYRKESRGVAGGGGGGRGEKEDKNVLRYGLPGKFSPFSPT